MTGIVILNYNNSNDTIACVKSILEVTNNNKIKIIVVDNGSRENDVASLSTSLQKIYPGQVCERQENLKQDDQNILPLITIYKLINNRGYANGNNNGIQILLLDKNINYIMVLNNDILFVADILEPLLSALKELKNAAIVSPLLYKKDQKTIDYTCARKNSKVSLLCLKYTLFHYDIFKIISYFKKKEIILLSTNQISNSRYIEIELPSGSCMLFTKRLYLDIGGFDPNTFLFWEENILYEKIKKRNLKNYLIPTAHCIHLGASTINKNKYFYLSSKCNYDSMLYYLRNYTTTNKIIIIYLEIVGLLFLNKIKVKQWLAELRKTAI